MSVRELPGTTAIITGASRGFGRATAVSLAGLGAHVVGVARNKDLLEELRAQLGDTFTPEVADVADPSVPARLLSVYRPQTLVLNAGTAPTVGTLQEQTWDSFSTPWNVDVKHVFNFTREALMLPLAPSSVVVSLSSGAALHGSPLSGGYAGAKSTIRFISAYAGMEGQRNGLDIRFVAALPQLTPATDLGRMYTDNYARLAGVSVAQFLESRGGILTAEQVGTALRDLATDDSFNAAAYILTTGGLQPLE